MFDNYVHMLTPSLLSVTPGIAHRDLKPENILCESPEKVLRAWFGMLQFMLIRNTSLPQCRESKVPLAKYQVQLSMNT